MRTQSERERKRERERGRERERKWTSSERETAKDRDFLCMSSLFYVYLMLISLYKISDHDYRGKVGQHNLVEKISLLVYALCQGIDRGIELNCGGSK